MELEERLLAAASPERLARAALGRAGRVGASVAGLPLHGYGHQRGRVEVVQVVLESVARLALGLGASCVAPLRESCSMLLSFAAAARRGGEETRLVWSSLLIFLAN